MKVDFNPGVTNHSLRVAPQIQQNNDDSIYKSSIRGAAPKSSFSFFLELPCAIFRIFTFTIYRLFVRNPKLPGLYLPDMTKEKKAEYEKILGGFLPDWNLDPRGRKGPSYQQKIQLLHQYFSCRTCMLEWRICMLEWHKKDVSQAKIKIHINGKEHPLPLLPKNFFTFKGSYQSFEAQSFLEVIANPENYERGKDSQIDLSFQLKCSIDRGYGPYRVYYSSLTCKNTLGADGKTITIQETNKRMRSRYSFFSSSANAPLK